MFPCDFIAAYIKIYSQTETSRVQMASQLRRKSSIPIIVQVGLALAVCVNMGLLHYVEGANFTVGAGYVESSTGSTYWTNTIGGLLRPEILLSSYQRWTNSVLVSVGDTLSKLPVQPTFHITLLLNSSDGTKLVSYAVRVLLIHFGGVKRLATEFRVNFSPNLKGIYFHCLSGSHVKMRMLSEN